MDIKKRFFELDALRGIAAVIIVIFHFTLGRNLSHYFNLGCVGVDIFFILSGFVIYKSIENTDSLRTFLINRFSRLYPVYWCCLSITTFILLLKNQSIYYYSQSFEWTNNYLINYVINTSMVQYFFSVRNIDGPYWTLTIELLFYGFIAIFLFLKKIHNIEYIGLLIALSCAIYAIDPIGKHWFFHKLLIACPIIAYFNLFYAGIILSNMQNVKITPIRCLLLLLTYIIQCLLFKNCYYNAVFITMNEYCIALALIYFTYGLFILNKLKVIAQSVLIWFGKISYPLYLIHSYIGIHILIPFFETFTNSIWISITLSFIIVVFLARLINKYVEIPSMKFLKKKFYSK